MPTFTSAILPPHGEHPLWNLTERYLNISRERYRAGERHGRKYYILPMREKNQSYVTVGLKILSYCTIVFPLLALAVRTGYRLRFVGPRIAAQTSEQENTASVATPTIVPVHSNVTITGSARVEYPGRTNIQESGDGYICGRTDYFKKHQAPHLYPTENAPPMLTDKNGEPFHIQPGEYVVKVFLEDLNPAPKKLQTLASQGILLPGTLIRALQPGESFSFRYKGKLCQATISQDDFKNRITQIERSLWTDTETWKGGCSIEPQPLTNTAPLEIFPTPSEQAAQRLAREISIESSPTSTVFVFKNNACTQAEMKISNKTVYPLQYRITEDNIEIHLGNSSDILIQLSDRQLIVYRHWPLRTDAQTAPPRGVIIPEHAAAIIELAQVGLSRSSIEKGLTQAQYTEGRFIIPLSK